MATAAPVRLYLDVASANLNTYAANSANTSLYVVGNNINGDLGFGVTGSYKSSFTAVSNFLGTNRPIQKIVSGYGFYLGLDTFGGLYAWGQNSYGQLGTGDTVNRASPTKIGNSSWSQIGSGQYTGYAIDSTGRLFAWGYNQYGQLGQGNTLNASSPVQLTASADSSFTAVSAGYGTFAYAIGASAGGVYFVGNNAYYGSGLTTPTYFTSLSPAIIAGLSTAASYVATTLTSGYIANTNYLYAIGGNSSNELGSGITSTPKSAALGYIFSPQSITSLQARAAGGLATTKNGTVYSWGDTSFGQIGNATTTGTQIGIVALPFPQSVSLISIPTWSKVSSGGDGHTLGIDTTGKLWAWGNNSAGQLGTGTTLSTTQPVQVGNKSNWAAVSAGISFSAALDTSGGLWVWGNNAYGQLGNSTTISISSPVQLGTSSWSMVSASNIFGGVGALDANKVLWSWGQNYFGQLGNGTTTNASSPVQVTVYSTNTSWAAIASKNAGGPYTNYYAITPTGALYGWGLNTNGTLGLGSTTVVSLPAQIGSSSWTMVSTNASSAAAIDVTGRLFTWGLNTSGQLGQGTTTALSSPVQVGTLASWIMVSVGNDHMMGILGNSPTATTGALYGWGTNAYGHLGNGTTINASSPVQVGTSSWTTVCAGLSQSIATGADSSVWMWGYGTIGLGDGTTVSKSSPVAAKYIASASSVNSWTVLGLPAGNCTAAFFGITPDSNLWGWGSNPSSALLPFSGNASSPIQIGNSSWTAVSWGLSHVAAIDANGRLFTWGLNTVGQLGNGTTVAVSSPVQLGTLSSWIAVACGDQFTMALLGSSSTATTGTLYVWGQNIYGQLGQGNTLNLSSPVVLSFGSGSISKKVGVLSGGQSAAAAIDTTGALYTWGYNQYGQLGTGSTLNFSSPVHIGSASWNAVSIGNLNTLGISSTNNLFAWGYNSIGQLGNNNTTSYSSPLQIGVSAWTAISTNSNTCFGVDGLGRLYGWGFNYYGQMGLGNTNTYSSPVQINSGTSFKAVVAGSQTTYALTTASNLYEWGYNSSGALANGITTNNSGPSVSVPNVKNYIAGLSATVVTVGAFAFGAITPTGALYTWGNNANGELGFNTGNNTSTPQQLGLLSWKAIGIGGAGGSAAGITTTGALYAWGYNANYNLGQGNTTNYSSPVLVKLGTSFTQVGVAYGSMYALSTTNILTEWGLNTSYQFGVGNATNVSSLTGVSPVYYGPATGVSFSTVSFAGGHSAAISTIGQLYTWGYNQYGQLGNLSTSNTSYAVVTTSGSWSVVTTSANYTMAIASNGTLWAWGQSTQGYSLGYTNPTSASSPIQVPGSATYIAVVTDAQGWVTSAMAANNVVYQWGTATGSGDALAYSGTTLNPTYSLATAIGTYSTIACGYFNMLGITSTGVLYSWGRDTNGQVGMANTTINSGYPNNSPNAALTSTNVYATLVSTSAGFEHSTALTKNPLTTTNPYSLYAWGINQFGQFGNGTTTNASSPVVINTYQYANTVYATFYSTLKQ